MNQILVSNGLFLLACGVILPLVWRTPHGFALAWMLAVGVAGGSAQLLLYEGFRYAPASVVAPVEYTGFIWAFLLGYLVWADVPSLQVWVGAAMIVGGGMALLWSERGHLLRSSPHTRGGAS